MLYKLYMLDDLVIICNLKKRRIWLYGVNLVVLMGYFSLLMVL